MLIILIMGYGFSLVVGSTDTLGLWYTLKSVQNLGSLELCVAIPWYNEDDSPALLYAVGNVSANGSAGDPVPSVDDQTEPMLLLQVEPPASPFLVPHEHLRHPPSVLVTERTILKIINLSFERNVRFPSEIYLGFFLKTQNRYIFCSIYIKIDSTDNHFQFISVLYTVSSLCIVGELNWRSQSLWLSISTVWRWQKLIFCL